MKKKILVKTTDFYYDLAERGISAHGMLIFSYLTCNRVMSLTGLYSLDIDDMEKVFPNFLLHEYQIGFKELLDAGLIYIDNYLVFIPSIPQTQLKYIITRHWTDYLRLSESTYKEIPSLFEGENLAFQAFQNHFKEIFSPQTEILKGETT